MKRPITTDQIITYTNLAGVWLAELLLALISVAPFTLGWLAGAVVWLALWCVDAFQTGYQRGRQ